MAVDCRHLTYRYGQFTAVDDVTLQVRPGETMGLLGPNGAGKTTVVRMLTTLTPVQQGELRIFGMDARDQTIDIRSNIGYVPQQLSIEPALTGRQNVEWFARLYGVPRAERAERVEQALDAMELLDVADRLAGTYSGGMVRRLEVAQALVNRPSLLVLDEPTVGLDPIARDGVWTQVQNMQAQFGMTVLLTTHYMEEADALCDRVALMHHGELRAVGTPAKLKSIRCRPRATLEDVFRHYAASDLSRVRRQNRSGLSVKSVPAERLPAVPVDQRIEAPAVTLVRAPRGWQRVRATLGRVGAFAIVELQKLQHDRTELVTRMVQPALWLLIFGTTFSQLARHQHRIGVVSGLPGAGHHRPVGAVHLDLLWHPDHLGSRRRHPRQAHGDAGAGVGADHRQGIRGRCAIGRPGRRRDGAGLSDGRRPDRQPAADPGGDGHRHARCRRSSPACR